MDFCAIGLGFPTIEQDANREQDLHILKTDNGKSALSSMQMGIVMKSNA